MTVGGHSSLHFCDLYGGKTCIYCNRTRFYRIVVKFDLVHFCEKSYHLSTDCVQTVRNLSGVTSKFRIFVYIVCKYIQSVPGGMCQTSGGCSFC
jgi:hypothetical protein